MAIDLTKVQEPRTVELTRRSRWIGWAVGALVALSLAGVVLAAAALARSDTGPAVSCRGGHPRGVQNAVEGARPVVLPSWVLRGRAVPPGPGAAPGCDLGVGRFDHQGGSQ